MKLNPRIQGKLTLVAEGRVSSPDLSDNGEVVVYNAFDGETTSVFRHRGADTVQLTTDLHSSMHASVSADGSTVVFTRYSAIDPTKPGNWDVARWQDRQGVTLIASGPGNEMSPQVSADGRVVVWDDDGDDRWSRSNICRWEDGRVEHLTEGDDYHQFPLLSGDGQRAVWRHYEGNKSEIWLRDQNGTVKPFLKSEGSLMPSGLTHAGRQLLYVDDVEGDDDLRIHNEPNRQERVVASEKKVDETWASLSADGNTVAWTGFDFRKGAPADTDVYLQHDGETLKLTQGDGTNYDPILSADGRTLVWTWMDDQNTNNRRIYKLELGEAAETR